MAHLTKSKGKPILVIGDSDKDADWIKSVNGGKSKQKDIAAINAAKKLHKKDEKSSKP